MPHLSWPELLPVTLRVQVAEAILLSGTPLDTYFTDDRSRAVFEQFFQSVSAELRDYGQHVRDPESAAREGAALDSYFERVGASMSRMRDEVSGSQVASRALSLILKCCASRVCFDCSGHNACEFTVTSGAADLARLRSPGHCLQLLREYFSWSSAIADAQYQGRSLAKPPSFSTGHASRAAELELGINAATNDSLGLRGPRTVHLSVDPKSIWAGDYLSLPYLFMHECIAHAYCGVAVSSHGRGTSAFHEGWMDCVAAEILFRHLTPETPFAPVAFLCREIAGQTEAVRALRYSATRPGRSKEVWEWIRGARAFQTLLWLFIDAMDLRCEATGQPPPLAIDEILRLSLDLNGSDISHAIREKFVMRIATKYVRSEAAVRIRGLAKRPQITDLIEKYLATHDFRRFVDRVTSA